MSIRGAAWAGTSCASRDLCSTLLLSRSRHQLAFPYPSLAEVVGAVVRGQVPGFVEGLHNRQEQGPLFAVVKVLLELLQVGHPNDNCVSQRTLVKQFEGKQFPLET